MYIIFQNDSGILCNSTGQPPLMRVSSRNIRIREGQLLFLKCRASGRPGPLFTWFKDDNELSFRSTSNIVVNRYVNCLLLIEMFEEVNVFKPRKRGK